MVESRTHNSVILNESRCRRQRDDVKDLLFIEQLKTADSSSLTAYGSLRDSE